MDKSDINNSNGIENRKQGFSTRNSNNLNNLARSKPISTKKAVEFLLEGSLMKKVCRYCLYVTSPLLELDQIFHIGGRGALFKVTIRDMIASFHPFKVSDNPNLPNKICNKCINRTISAYLFLQQCERSERAIRNCLDDVHEKLVKLDPLDSSKKKRGRKKLNPNFNKIHVQYRDVIDYADPIINIINQGSSQIENSYGNDIKELECLKCCQILPNVESLLNHEKIHPKSMWYNCRKCGKSFPKISQIRRHINRDSRCGKHNLASKENGKFTCKKCLFRSDGLSEHLEHIEKHKFKIVMKHLVERNMDKLCTICLNKDVKMVDLNKRLCLHGGHKDVNGDRTIYNILGETLPEMNTLQNYTGTKICERCLDHAITSYLFVHHSNYIRNRLNKCVALVLDKLIKLLEPKGNIIVEISQNLILTVNEQDDFNDLLLIDENDEIDETKLKIDVLEDEFRIKSESDNESNEKGKDDKRKNYLYSTQNITHSNKNTNTLNDLNNDYDILYNPARNVTRTYTRKTVNGYQTKLKDIIKKDLNDVYTESLTVERKKKPVAKLANLTCPYCSRKIISRYYLRKHLLKHLNKKVKCLKCGLEFKSKFFLHEHVNMVHVLGYLTFCSCNICGRAFTDENKMKLHLRSHNQRCELCEKLFVSQKHYECHMQRHAAKINVMTQKTKLNCSFCEKEFTEKNQLSLHVNKVHLQLKSYSCEMCEEHFYTEYNLRQHKRIHSLITKEKCQLCNKTFKTRKHLVLHIRKHLKVKPYCCQICRQNFYSEFSLRKHLKHFHVEYTKCKFCHNVYRNNTLLEHHIKLIHNTF